MTEFIETHEGRRIAFEKSPGAGPTVVFLGGFVSDMQGTKAVALESWARERGRSFVRFDYSGHGLSSGRIEDGCIGDWLADALAVIRRAGGPCVLVGSSMGGWISLLVARDAPDLVAGLVTIAAAPDFTETLAAELSPGETAALARDGFVRRPSDYSPDGYLFTRRLFDDGRDRSVFGKPLGLPMPVRFLQGTADAEVSPETALRLLDHTTGPDIRLTLVKDADHRFSSPDCLRLIEAAVSDVIARVR